MHSTQRPSKPNAIVRSGFIALSALALASPVAAQTEFRNFDYYCSMGSFQVCASVRLESVDNQLRMFVWNLNGTLGVQHTMTDVGLYHSNTAFKWDGKINSYAVTYHKQDGTNTNITSYWTEKGAQDINNLEGVKLELKEGNAGNSGIVGCTVPGGAVKWSTCFNGTSSFDGLPYVKFTFNMTKHFALNSVQLRWHSQQLPDGSSIKCDTGGAGDQPDCVPSTSVPEPATIVLLSTGLLSMAGYARRRRKAIES